MDLKGFRIQSVNGSLASRVLLRAFLLASAFWVIPLLQNLSGSDFGLLDDRECIAAKLKLPGPNPHLMWNPFVVSISGSFGSIECEKTVNLTAIVVRELMGMKLLSSNAKALSVGEGSAAAVLAMQEMGISNALGVYRHPFFSLRKKQHVYELDYEDESFDFVFSRDLDKVSVPALLVLEVERVLKPGGVGALVVGVNGLNSNNLIRSATPVSSLLKSSDVVHVGFMNGSSIGMSNDLTLVVFKKKSEVLSYFQQVELPADCPSIVDNKHFIEKIEPLTEEKPVTSEVKFAYLPNFLDISAKKRLVYIDIGAGENLNSTVMNWWLPTYPIDREAFNVYFVDHNTSVMLSYVKKPRITFVYHPGLAGNKGTANATDLDVNSESDLYLEDEGFDFLAWFKETVRYADFVVMKMNAGNVEMKFLHDLLQSGAICSVDELFLKCSGHVEGEGALKGECRDVFKGLRSSGVFVHQWWSD